MQTVHVTATYATPSGRLGKCERSFEAKDHREATDFMVAVLRRRFRGKPRKVSIRTFSFKPVKGGAQ